jgi:non-specific serine/threonine protein kinase
MGEVYRAEDTRLGREVALKVLPRETARNQAKLERFSREACAIAALNHPNIVTIHSVEEAGGTHFLTMELVSGHTLDGELIENGLPLERLFDLAIPIADALSCAHDKGIVHRDLKPANVMVTEDGRVKVLDFGLAKLQGGETDLAEAATVSRLLTQDGAVMGTYPYMSPEQVEGKRLDSRTDLFSFGTLLYEMATGRRPFEGNSSASLMSSILRDDPENLADCRPDLPRHLGRIVRRCLEKDPRDRFQSARSIYNELKSLRTETNSELLTGTSAAATRAVRYERPWIAVTRFKVGASDPALEDFAEGLAEDITAGLARFNYLSVVARESTRSAASQSGDVSELAERLKARFLIEGSVRKAGAIIRVGARLVDLRTGAHLWAESYTRDMDAEDIFSVQDDITGRIVATVADSYGVLARSLIAAIEDKPDPELMPSEWLLRMFDFLMQLAAEPHGRLRDGVEEAVKRHPRDADVRAVLAITYLCEWCFGFNPRPNSLERALAAAERAVELDGTNEQAYQVLAQVYFLSRNLARFRPAAERAMALNRFDTSVAGILGTAFVHAGEFERGAAICRRAMDLNPHHAGHVQFGPLWMHFAKGEYEQALDCVARVNMPGYFWQHLATASICGHLGHMAEGRAAVEKLLKVFPDFLKQGRQQIEVWHYQDGLTEPLLEGLRRVGLVLPEAEPASEDGTGHRAPADVDGHPSPSPGPRAGDAPGRFQHPDPSGSEHGNPGFETPPSDRSRPGGPTVTSTPDETRDKDAGIAMLRSLAVLPLANLSGDPEQAFFVAGMHEAIIGELARLSALTVISRRSVMDFDGSTDSLADIAGRLGVDAVVEGSVLKAGNAVRINLQLINAVPERHLWAESFEGPLEDVLGLHRQVAAEVSSAVRARLTADEAERLEERRRVDPAVYEIYLRAKHLDVFTPEENIRSIALYEAAVRRDPDFAEAYAGMARNYALQATLGTTPPNQVLPKAADAARRAMELDPESGEARSVQGYVSLALNWDWDAAREALADARSKEPNNVGVLLDSIMVLALSGAVSDAVRLADRAARLDPMNPSTLFWAGWAYFIAERYPHAIDLLTSAHEMDNTLCYPALWIGVAHGMLGHAQEAADFARRAEELDPESRSTDFLCVLGAAYVMGGLEDEARRILKRIESLETQAGDYAAQRSFLHGWLGEYDNALEQARIAIENRSPGLMFWGNHPVCDRARGDARIISLMEEIGFPAIRPLEKIC